MMPFVFAMMPFGFAMMPFVFAMMPFWFAMMPFVFGNTLLRFACLLFICPRGLIIQGVTIEGVIIQRGNPRIEQTTSPTSQAFNNNNSSPAQPSQTNPFRAATPIGAIGERSLSGQFSSFLSGYRGSAGLAIGLSGVISVYRVIGRFFTIWLLRQSGYLEYCSIGSVGSHPLSLLSGKPRYRRIQHLSGQGFNRACLEYVVNVAGSCTTNLPDSCLRRTPVPRPVLPIVSDTPNNNAAQSPKAR